MQLQPPADTETALMILRNVGGSCSIQRVSMGADNSGGSGYKVDAGAELSKRTAEQILKEQIGQLIMQVAQLIAALEEAQEKLKQQENGKT